MRCVTRNDVTQNWIESNNLHVGFWCISLNVNEIEWMLKCRLCEKVGNLAFALSANWLRINTFVCCINFRLFSFSLRSCLTETIIYGYNLQLCLSEVVMPSNKKPPWGPGPPALQAPPSSAEQGIIRCRAGVGGQGKTCGDGKPEGPDRPLENGVVGIEISKSSRRQPCCCCHWYLSTSIRYMWCTWTLRKSDYPWEPRNSPRAMRLLGFTNLVESAWLFSFLRCEAVLLAIMNLLL